MELLVLPLKLSQVSLQLADLLQVLSDQDGGVLPHLGEGPQRSPENRDDVPNNVTLLLKRCPLLLVEHCS